jgi:hypothetical protein
MAPSTGRRGIGWLLPLSLLVLAVLGVGCCCRGRIARLITLFPEHKVGRTVRCVRSAQPAIGCGVRRWVGG